MGKRDNHTPDACTVSSNQQNINGLLSLSDRLIQSMNLWLSCIGFGREDDCHFGEEDNDNNGKEGSVILIVRYKYNDQVYELSIKDDDVLELPSSHATVIGPSHTVS